MATAYSSEVAVGTYNRLRLRVEYSGTSATCYMEFRRTSSYTGSWSDSQATITFNGTTKSAPYSYSGTVGTSWVQLCNASGFSVSTSGGTYNWTFNNPGGSSVLGCSGSVTIDAQGTAPSGLSLSNVSSGTDWVKGTVAITDWGGVGDSSTRYKNLSVLKTSDKTTSERRYQRTYGNSLSDTITVNNSTEYGTMTIVPNTKYWLWWYATNGTYDVSSPDTSTTTVYTKAVAPTVSVSDYTDTTIVISYSTTADGGAYSKNIQYSLDGSTWTTGATVSSASATSGTYTISGLTAGTTYSIRTRVSTTAGTTTGSTLSQKTAQAPTKPTVSGTSGVTSNTISYGTTSFGYPASGTVYLYGGTSSSPTTQLTSKTSTGTSSYTHSSLTANKRYYYRARAYNGKVYSDYSTEVSVYTKAAAPTISVSGVTAKTVTIAYSTSADGGAYYKYIDYSLDGTNWTQGAAITTSSATSGTFTITGLAPDTSYTIRTKIRTTAAGDTSGPTVTASTKPALYGSVSGHAELVEKLYGSVNALGNPPIKGNTTQQTYTGKNFLTFPDGSGTTAGFTWSVADGVITLDGGTGSGSGTAKILTTTLFKLKAETRRLTIIPISGTWTTGTMGIRPVTSEESQRGYQQWNTGNPQSNATFTYTETQASEAARVELYVGTNAVFSNYKFRIMWTAGSTDDFNYEPYVGGAPSPNPNYPQAVNVATGEQKIYFHSKNLSPIVTGYSIGTNSGASYTKTNGTIVVSTNSTGTTLNKGIYMTKASNIGYCPAAYEDGSTVSFTIVASAESQFAYRNEGQAYNYETIGTTPMRLSFPSGDGNMAFYAKEQNITFTISNFQVESGSTATEFSDYAQLYAVNFGGIGKNKFNINSIERGYELLTSGKTSANADWWVSDYIPVKANTAYTSTGVSSNFKCWYDNNKAFVSRATAATATSPANAAYLRVNGTIASIASNPNVQIEEGSSSTTYEAYEFIELCKIDNYQDYVHKSGNDWYIHKEINKITLNGTESWDTISSCFRLRIDGMAGEDDQMAVGAVKSDKFTAASYRNVYNGDVDYGIAQRASGASGIAIRNKDISTVADFKTWLGTSTPVVYYPLATPTETKITNSTLISQLNALWSATTYGDDTVLTIGAVDLQAIGTDIFQSTRRIEKFYGSVNNKTKLIYEE